MHDPSTVAFEIRSPIKRKSGIGSHGYRKPIITIWHEDPEDRTDKCGVRADDTCGWFSPPYTPADRDRIHKLGAGEYAFLFRRRHCTQKGEDYAAICFEPTTYDAIYWAWRAIKYSERKQGWKFGPRRRVLTRVELEEIYTLSANPMDNLQHSVAEVTSDDACGNFFLTVYRCYLRHHRPWYRHPRWHFWHWRFQVHPWRTFRRWAFSRCAGCGKRFPWGYSPVSFQWHKPRTKWFRSEVGSYHSECANMTEALHKEPAKGTA